VIKFTSCLPRVGGSLRLPPPLKTGRHDIAEILLKVVLKHQKSNQILSEKQQKPSLWFELSVRLVPITTNCSWQGVLDITLCDKACQ
jgi:hypothetical protein